jgi:hypothetical protein
MNTFIYVFISFMYLFGNFYMPDYRTLRTLNEKSWKVLDNMPVDNLWKTLRTLWISRRISLL